MQEAFFFGPSERQLFAIYHPPSGIGDEVLTIVCPPMFAEYSRTHSTLRKLAVAMAEQGQHVLRVDYSGTGDSFGDIRELTLEDWLNDITCVLDEGRSISGCNTVRLLGVRASSFLVCNLDVVGRDIDRIVLWDPVYNGASYLRSLVRKQVLMLEHNHFISRAVRRESGRGFTMHHLSEMMLDELGNLSAEVYAAVPKSKLRVVRTTARNDFPISGVSESVVPFPCHWETQLESQIMSQPVLEKLVSCLTT